MSHKRHTDDGNPLPEEYRQIEMAVPEGTALPDAAEPDDLVGRVGLLTRRVKRRVKRYALRRKRRRAIKKKNLSRRVTLVLVVVLLILGGCFAWAVGYVRPESEGRHITMDEFAALAAEKRIESGVFKDEDNRLEGSFAAEPIESEADAKPEGRKDKKAQDKKAQDKKAQDKNEQDRGKARDKRAEKTEPSVAPAGAGPFWLDYPSSDAAFLVLSELLAESGARTATDQQPDKATVRVLYQYLLPLLILATFFGLVFATGRRGGGGIGDVTQFGTLDRKRQKRGFAAPVTFGDVGGAAEAVDELKEVVDYLSNPDRYEELGAIPPKGVLLFGPPGCGKTLIAKAVAGEAGVPFFSVAGAEFVESLVGVGAARVRDLFARVRAVAPAIVFIDELDAAGRKRGVADHGGGSDEREQTLNQLLVEMDGFEVSSGIVVIGATNRPDILDPALLRPGRFDRHITVDQPDQDGRVEILQLHSRGKFVSDEVDLAYIARRTSGFSGADLANVMNEAALLAIRQGRHLIETRDCEEAIQRVLHGPKRRGRVLSGEERRRIAYHEAGHVVVAAATGDAESVHRVTILARSKGLGISSIQNDADSVIVTSDRLWSRLVTAMGGLGAEILTLGQPSTGAEADLEQATQLALDMVGRYGLSPRLGRARLLASDVDHFINGSVTFAQLGTTTQDAIDDEVKRLLDVAEKEAIRLLEGHREALDRLASELAVHETLEGDALAALVGPVGKTIDLADPFAVKKTNGAVPVAAP